MARAIWKGVVKFGDVELPVRLFAAVQDRDIHFRLLHAADGVPIQQHMVNPETGEVVPGDQILKAYEDDDAMVILREEELAAIEPEPARDIEVLRFVEPDAITEQWYDRPYYLGPDGSRADYFALARALQAQNRRGIARWTMRNKEYVGALMPEGDYLMLITLRNADEVIPASALQPPAGRKPGAKELKLAQQLVAALEDDFDPNAFHDEFRERVLEFIDLKSRGQAPRVRSLRPRRARAQPLADALTASLKAAQKERKRA